MGAQCASHGSSRKGRKGEPSYTSGSKDRRRQPARTCGASTAPGSDARALRSAARAFASLRGGGERSPAGLRLAAHRRGRGSVVALLGRLWCRTGPG